MKILIETQSPVCEFSELKPGDVFRTPGQEEVFMVCFEDTDPSPGTLPSNAVNLKTGEICLIGNIMVERVHAVLHIKS